MPFRPGKVLIPALLAQLSIMAAFAAESDEAQIRTQANQYVQAFNRGDSQALASFWDENGTFSDLSGKRYKGRNEIASYFQNLFKMNSAVKVNLTIDSLRFPSENVAIEEGHARSNNNSRGTRYLAVHTKSKTDGHWSMYDVVESAAPERESGIDELRWLLGQWTARGQGANADIAMKLKVEEKPANFLCLTYTNKDGQIQATETIGVNPKNKLISSWSFHKSGGIGTGYFVNEDNTWTKVAESYEADGLKGGAVYILKKLNGNAFTFNSSSRYLAGSRLPNGNELLLEKDGSNGGETGK